MHNKINNLTINNNKLVADRQNLINIINNLQQQLTKLNDSMSTIKMNSSEKQSLDLSRFQHIEEEPQVSVSFIEEEPQVSVSFIEEEPSEKHSINLSRFQHIDINSQDSIIEEQSFNLSRFQHFNIL
jgi:hypothetical protein